ncbi:MAG: hypothetical protein ACRDTH_14870 [Pseudonocardiaceae bacterium]
MTALTVQLLIALGIALPAFLGGMFARRKTSADVEVTLSTEARAWAKDWADNARVAMDAARSAEARARDCQDRMDLMERHIARLEVLMREHGIEPPPFPGRERST